MTTLYRIEPRENMARFYALSVQPTLFGEWTLVREWGRIGRRPQALVQTFSTRGEAAAAQAELASVKHRKGYS
jgi:predicted DNA-binding WGR domain protein